MDKTKVKSAINVAALILVPLINERKRIKDHEEVQRAKAFSLKTYDHSKELAYKTKVKTIEAKDKTVETAQHIKAAASSTKNFVTNSNQKIQKRVKYNQQMNQHKQLEKAEEKRAKKAQKLIETLNKNFEAAQAERQKIEQKKIKDRQDRLIKEMHASLKDDKLRQKENAKQRKIELNQQKKQSKKRFGLFKREPQESNATVIIPNAPLFEKHRQEMKQHLGQ